MRNIYLKPFVREENYLIYIRKIPKNSQGLPGTTLMYSHMLR